MMPRVIGITIVLKVAKIDLVENFARQVKNGHFTFKRQGAIGLFEMDEGYVIVRSMAIHWFEIDCDRRRRTMVSA